MTVNFTSTNASVAASPLDIITAALYECQVLSQGESPTPEDSAWLLQKLQRLIDMWNVERGKIFTVTFNTFNMPANTQPITMGPGGIFNVPQRPTKLVAAMFLIPNSGATTTDLRLNVRDADWWADQTIKNLTSSISTDVYYEPDNPLGNLFFWPVCTVQNPIRLETWSALTQAIDLVTPLAMPQGYWNAIVYTLAMESCPSFGKEISPSLAKLQQDSVRAITNNNSVAPRISTAGAGIPKGKANGGRYNFLDGRPW